MSDRIYPAAIMLATSMAAAIPHQALAASPSPDDQPDIAAPTDTPPEPLPLGWLSDPNEPPDDLWEALFSGKIHLDNNFRVEFADTTGRNSSTAVTNRLRLGYETKPLHGVSGYVEMESVVSPNRDNYWVPATADGTPDRTVIADPTGTELNQAWGRFRTDSLGESDISLDLKGGRQRIKLDDDRFIGNVGWRQFEQTFDSVSMRSNLGIDSLSAFYAYVWGVQRIFGPDGPNPDSDSHLINVSLRVADEVKVTAFGYLLDFRDDDPLNSSNSFGVRLAGRVGGAGGTEDTGFSADYDITYARQTDAGANPTDYAADFFAARIGLTKKDLGQLFAGYQFLGSDDGAFAFRFPLGTNHAYQGFADNFLVTPAVGLQDLYAGVKIQLPWEIEGGVIYHEFWSDVGNAHLGREIDLVAARQLTPNLALLVKAAFFDGDSSQPDTNRFWVQTTMSF
jgi:hypothetical protein